MGQSLGVTLNPDPVDMDNPPTFDPLYGFPNGRQQRNMIATEEEMISAKLPLNKRDYCAHVLIDFQQCRKRVWPLLYKCHHEKHAYAKCEYEDHLLRMMEFERERRLLYRKQRKEEREATFN